MKIIGTLILGLAICGCAGPSKDQPEPDKGAGHSGLPDSLIDADKVEKREDGFYYLKGEKKPFTGSTIKHHENGVKKEVETYKEGKYHGVHMGWYADGKKEYETTWDRGVEHGLIIRWSENGNKIFVQSYVAGVLEYKKTVELMLALVQANKKKLGADHLDIATSIHYIGMVHRYKGEYDHALEFYHKALAIWLKILAPDHPDVATCYNNIGEALAYKAEYDEAMEYYHKALAIWLKKLGPDHPDIAFSYNNIGEVYRNKGEYDKAVEYLKKSLAIMLKQLGPDHPSVATGYNNIGLAHASKAEYDEALEYYRKALAIGLKKLGPEHLDVAYSHNNIAGLHYQKGDYDKALDSFQKSLAIKLKQLGPDHPSVATGYNNIAGLYDEKAEYDKALEYYRKSLAIWLKKLGPEHPLVAQSYHNIGFAHANKAEYDEAMEYYQKSLAIRIKKLGKGHPEIAQSYHTIGVVQATKGDYDKALEFYHKALAINIKKLGLEHPSTAMTYNSIGWIHYRKGEYDKALELFQRMLTIMLKRLGPDHHYVGVSYNNIGLVQTGRGDYDKALEFYHKALAINLKKLGLEHPSTAMTYHNIGHVHNEQYEFDKALEYYQKSLAIRIKKLPPDHPDVAMSYSSIGGLHTEKGDYDKALEYYRKSLEISLKKLGAGHPDVAASYNNMGTVHASKGDHEKALIYFQKSETILLKKLGPDHPAMARSYDHIGYAQLGLGNLLAARAAARKGQKIRGKRLAYMLSFTSERERLAYQLATQNSHNLLGTLGSTPNLTRTILRNKGIVLSSILEDQLAAQASSDPKIKELVSQLRTASRILNKLEVENPKDTSEAGWKAHRAKLEGARGKAEKLQQALARNVGGYGKARKSLSLTIKDVQGGLAEAAVLMEFIAYRHFQRTGQGEFRYGVVILAGEGESKWVPLGPIDEPLFKLLSQYSPMKPASDEAYEKVLRGLYDRLMAPVVKQLPKGTQTLILSPDGPLNFLSFATLLTEKDRFLCEDYTIKYVSSGRDLVPRKQINQPKGSLVVFANPTYDETPVQLASANGVGVTLRLLDRDELRGGLKFKALPGTQKEADYLGDKAKDWMLQPKVYTGKTATEAVISGVQSPRILHLATHGFFLPEDKAKNEPRGKRLMVGLGNEQQKYRGPIRNPMHRSGLALAGAQKTLDAWAKGETPPTENDGILTAAEASVLNLKGTWLVTLSACETGQGEARSGEGVLGLRRAFIQAGAQNLLMTLWPVSDKYTVPFMKDFYERAIASGDAPTTLAEVQKEMLLKYRKKYGTKLAVQLYGPFIMSFQGAE